MTNLLHNFLCHEPIILESEDMFPGLDSSVLGNKTKEDKKARFLKMYDRETMYHRAHEHLTAFLMHNDALIWEGPKQPDEVWYSEFDWLGKYKFEQESLAPYRISKSSPIFNNIEKHVRSLEGYSQRERYYAKERDEASR